MSTFCTLKTCFKKTRINIYITTNNNITLVGQMYTFIVSGLFVIETDMRKTHDARTDRQYFYPDRSFIYRSARPEK
jgi:hypothetical protein